MADATLGSYYFQLSPSTRGIKKAIEDAIGNVDTQRATKSISSGIVSNVGSAFKTVAKVGVGAVAGIGAAVTGLAMAGGISRALAIENAQAKLKGLGHDTKSVAGIMQSALDSVKGTAYGLGDAATVAASLSASGIKEGGTLTTVLKTVADTAQISGRSLTDVGAIFGSVAARGKLQGDDMLQLMSAGVPVLQFLSQQLGVTTADVSDMVTKGKIDFQTFADAMQAGLGGAALAGGETFSGAMANVRAALSRLGAAAATPVLAGLKDIFNALIPVFDGATEALSPLLEALGTKVASASSDAVAGLGDLSESFDKITDGFGAVYDLVVNGDFTSKFREIFNVEEDSPVVGVLSKIRGAVDGIIAGAKGLWEAFSPIVKGALAVAFGTLLISISGVLSALGGIGQWIGQNSGLVGTFGVALGVVAGGFKAVQIQSSLAAAGGLAKWIAQTRIGTAVQAAFNLVMNANPIMLAVTAIAALVAGLVYFFAQTETGKRVWGELTAAFQSFISWIGPAWSNLMNGIGEVWSTVWQGVAGFFTTYVVNPISTAMAAVGGFFSAAWNNVIKPVWDAIVTGIKIAITAIITMALLPFQIAWNVWSAIFGWAYTNAIKPALDAIGLAFTVLYAVAIKPALDAIAAGWNWIAGIASTVWGSVSGAVTNAWNTITAVVQAATALVMNWVSVRFEAIKAGATIVWNAISTTISTVWATIKGIVLGAAGFVYNVVSTYFTNVKNNALLVWNLLQSGISMVWNGIKTIAQAGAQWVLDKVMVPFNALKSGAVLAFQGMKDGIGKAWDGLKAVAAKPVNFIIDTVYTNGIKHLAETVASKVGLNLKLPTIKGITGYATGGVLPGYAPGRDSILAAVSPGEGILVPEAVRGLGPGFVGWANRTFSGGRSKGGAGTGMLGGMPAFADGGIVGWFKDKAKGITDFFSDPLGAVANLITTPVKALMGGAGSGLFADLGKGAIDQILGAIPNFFKKQVEKLGGSSSQLVNAAMRAVQMGVPYVWGGSSVPPGLDCSGLVYWAAQQLGLGWPRLTAAGYQAASVAKSMSNVVPGDLLFWGNPAYHVAIAAGAGKMVEEPKPGMTARYTNIWGNPSVGSYVGKNSTVAAPEYLKYDQGGYLQPGLTLAYNATGKPEPVLTSEQAQGFGSSLPEEVTLVVDGEEFHAYVDRRAKTQAIRVGKSMNR